MADRPQLVASDGSNAGKSAQPATTASSPNVTVKVTPLESSSKIHWAVSLPLAPCRQAPEPSFTQWLIRTP